jgi:glycosyltransferase involved in cell wall biosynthesis
MSRALRILVAHNVPKKRTGGMSRLMGLLHDQVVLAGHSVEYFCADDVPRWVRGFPARLAFPFYALQHAVRAARGGNPFDVINVHEPSGAAVSLLKWGAGSPHVVVTSYGIERRGWERLMEEVNLGREQLRLRTRLTYPATVLWQARVALKLADHVFCSNMEDFEYLKSRLHIAGSKITRIHSGADHLYASASQNRDYSRAERLLFSGTWLNRKGVLDLVPAVERLLGRYSNLRFVVLNPGVPEAKVKACFAKAANPRVSCIQAEPETGIACAIAAADIFVLPSLFEGTPLTLIEAMFGGLPIVTTDTCGMKDVIEDGRNGLLVPTRSPEAIVNAVERLFDNATLREQLGRAARSDAVKHYEWQSVAEPVRRLYEEICSG